LLSQIDGARAHLEAQLSELKRAGVLDANPALAEELRGQLQILHALSQFLPSASGTALAQVRAEVATSVAATGSLTQQAQGAVAAADAARVTDYMAELAHASDDARRSTDDFLRDFYEERIFEPYLRFDTAEDERAYREREAQRKKAIEEAKAQNTPQGELRANELAQAQLEDAGDHGADRSPDYQPMLDRLERSHANLNAAISPPQAKEEHSSVAAFLPKQPDHVQAGTGLRNAGVIVADQTQTGHGVTVDASIAALIGRG